jgi:ABC-2 type transport system permease protein
MRRALAITLKDVRRIYRTRSALVMMLVAPLALSALLGFAFGGGKGFSIPAVKTAVANLDSAGTAGGDAATTIVGVLRSPQLKDLIAVQVKPDAAAARAAVDGGKAAVAVIVPRGFGAALTSTTFGQRSSVELYENPTDTVGPAIVSGIVQQTIDELNGARAAAQAAAQISARRLGLTSGGPAKVAQDAAHSFATAMQTAGLNLTDRGPRVPGADREVGVAARVLAGMVVFFMFFGANAAARTILEEQSNGTLPRLFTTPAPRSAILGGKFGSAFLTVLVQAAVVLAAGRLLFGSSWGAPLGAVLLTVAGAAVASGLSLLLISFCRTLAQAGAIPSGVFLVLALLGGNFTGTAQQSGVFSVVQRLTPNGQLLRGWDVSMRGGSLGSLAVPLIVSFAFAAVFFGGAVFSFRRRFAQGVN